MGELLSYFAHGVSVLPGRLSFLPHHPSDILERLSPHAVDKFTTDMLHD